MKRHFITAVSVLALTLSGFAQHAALHAASSSSHSLVRPTSPSSVRTKSAPAAKFQEAATALNLSSSQKKSVSQLLQSTRQQLQATSSDTNLSSEQQAIAMQAIKSDMVQKFVGMLTPEQKKQLADFLAKRQQQQSSGDSSSGNAGSAPSAPDIPSVDAPSSSDSQDSSTDNAPADQDQGTTDSAPSSALNADASAQPASTSAAAQGSSSNPSASAAPEKTATATSKSGPLTDAQLAAILNSFIQDEAVPAKQKTSPQPPQANPGS
jgi:hypothetical protein